jgi:exo-beta-1,3-glucanase (GH17 family)
LKKLRAVGFTGLITYGSLSTLGAIVPRVAHEEGFEGFLMGIWDPRPPTNPPLPPAHPLDGNIELKNAQDSQAYVTGYIIGNEGLSDTGVSLCNPTERICYTLTQLQDAVSYLRAQTNNSKPITTSEQWEDYLQGGNAALMRGLGDWMMPIVHPYNQVPRISDPSASVQWTLARYNQFVNAAPGRAILFKEVGLPSAGASNVSEAGQESYYRQLKSTAVLFAYFEAFNQPFKYAPDKPVEAHWGIFRETRAEAGNVPCL